MKKIIICLLACLLLLSGCTGRNPTGEETLPRIPITVVCGKEPYAAEQVIRDPDFLAALEAELGIRIQLETVYDLEPFEEDVEISFTGGLITGNCLWMIPLSSGYKMAKLEETASSPQSPYGRLGASTYGYVFTQPGGTGSEPVLLANLDILESAGVDSVPYTPEGMRTLLQALGESCEVPLAVYGTPSEKGFAPLLGLFGIAPAGGREFNLENGEITFDKIGENARDYLTYANGLYEEKLIPEDCVILNEYAARNLFLDGKAALAVFPNAAAGQDALALAGERGFRAGAVGLPVSEGKLETGVYNRSVGLISFATPYAREILAVYTAVEAAIAERAAEEIPALSEVSLFYGRVPVYTDPLEPLIPEVSTLYKKHLLDWTVVCPYYAQILTGARIPEGFDDMKDSWLNPYVQLGEAPAELSGASLMQIINGWYYKSQKD